MKKLIPLFIAICCLGLVGCNDSTTPSNSSSSEEASISIQETSTNSQQTSTNPIEDSNFTIKSNILDAYSTSQNGSETIYTINKSGEYTLSGSLNGQIIFASSLDTSVKLNLNNVSITSSSQCIFWQSEIKKVELSPLSNTINSLTSTGIQSCVESNNNIEISGSGSLSINSKSKHALDGSNLTVSESPKLTITASKDGFHGKNILIGGGDITISNVDDAFQADINSKGSKGTFTMTNGNVVINNANSIVKADTSIDVQGGKINATNCEASFIPNINTPTISIAANSVTIDGQPYNN